MSPETPERIYPSPEQNFSFQEISDETIPKEIMERLARVPNAKLFSCSHEDGGRTYIASNRKVAKFIDADSNGTRVGHAIIQTDETGLTGTIVGTTRSETPRLGLGTRRLVLMNQFSRKEFGVPLNSSIAVSPEARRRWEQLEAEGKAKSLIFNGIKRYQFVI